MSAEILKEIKEIKEQQNEIYKRLFVSNGQTALVEEVKQIKAKSSNTETNLIEHIKEDKIVNCGNNKVINKFADVFIKGFATAMMVLLVLGIKTWINTWQ